MQYSDAQESSLQQGPKMLMEDGGWGERRLFRTFGNWERGGGCEKEKGLERQQGTDVEKGWRWERPCLVASWWGSSLSSPRRCPEVGPGREGAVRGNMGSLSAGA